MDPALFDLLWQVAQDVGAREPYSIVSSYREPKTNAMLRAKSSGVAENSQHMTGKAMDVYIKGVKLSTLRAAAMRYQVGGVGYYPTSGSPFVHLDVAHRGLGTAACGPDTAERWRITPGPFRWRFTVSAAHLDAPPRARR
jgi:uncharacterized protein YcbK (DUF882 family)